MSARYRLCVEEISLLTGTLFLLLLLFLYDLIAYTYLVTFSPAVRCVQVGLQ